MRKIDLDKFICSLAKQHGEMPKIWENALAEQGLAYNCFTNSLRPIMPYKGDVSPRYKIGDYAVSVDDYVYKVIDVYKDIDKITNETKTKYKLKDINAPVSKLINVEDFDKASHLWTIDDAMYGETVYLKDTDDCYWLAMVDCVIDEDLYVLHSYSFITKEHYGGENSIGSNIWGPVSSIQQVCPASVSQRKVLLDFIEKSKSCAHQSVATNVNSAEKEKSEPIFSYHVEENAWNSATDFIPTDKQRCLCYDKSLNGIYCYTYVKETNAWYYQSNPEREDLTFLCAYDCNRIPIWMTMPEIPSFMPKSDSENEALVSHKFSIGEWITNGERILRIGCVCEEEPLYYFDEKNFGSSYDTIENVDANYHLWSIDDAKKDDILSFSGNDKIIIKFESKEYLSSMTIVKSNAHALFAMYDEDVKLNSSTENKAWPVYSDWKPATSEEKKALEKILSSISQVAKKEIISNNEESE